LAAACVVMSPEAVAANRDLQLFCADGCLNGTLLGGGEPQARRLHLRLGPAGIAPVHLRHLRLERGDPAIQLLPQFAVHRPGDHAGAEEFLEFSLAGGSCDLADSRHGEFVLRVGGRKPEPSK
jgi:hypothetical protein